MLPAPGFRRKWKIGAAETPVLLEWMPPGASGFQYAGRRAEKKGVHKERPFSLRESYAVSRVPFCETPLQVGMQLDSRIVTCWKSMG